MNSMRKILRISALVTLLLLLKTNIAHAAALLLERIGTETVTSQTMTQWTNYGTRPSFSGSATPGAVVSIQIDDIVDTAEADETGYWSFLPFSLTYGAHDFHLSSGTESLVFTLNIASQSGSTTATPTPTLKAGVTPTSSASSTTSTTTKGGLDEDEELPVSGSMSATAFLVISGLGMLVAAGAARATFAGMSASERDVIDDRSDAVSSASPHEDKTVE